MKWKETFSAQFRFPNAAARTVKFRVSLWLRALTLASCFSTCAAQAWSSRDGGPLFERVHQIALENVFKNDTNVPASALKILRERQEFVDKDQQATNSFEHSMTGLLKGQSLKTQMPLYITQTEAFVSNKLAAAITARRGGLMPLAFTNLGVALHPLQDATSPSHEGFQSWSDDEGYFAMFLHVVKERSFPGEGVAKARLEGVVRWAFDIYMERTNMPPRFFNDKGQLQIPDSYWKARKP